MSDDHISIFFLKKDNANFLVFLEHLAHISDSRYTEVHAELIVGRHRYAAVNSPRSEKSCIFKCEVGDVHSSPHVEVVDIPVSNLMRAVEIAESIWSRAHASYSIPYFDMAVPSFMLGDLDLDPTHWDYLYCSQFVLLYLRICAREGILTVPAQRLRLLDEDHCNSLQCTPAHLRHVLSNVLGR